MPKSVTVQIRRKRGMRKMRINMKSRRRRARPTTVVQRGITPIAPRTIARLKYCSFISRTLSLGVGSDNLYRLNSIFDPDLTGTGTQPYGRDTYAAIYNRYRVFAVAYKATFSHTGTAAANFSVLPTNSNSIIIDPELAREMPRSRNGIGGALGAAPVVLRGRVSLPALNGCTRQQYMADDRFQALQTDNPLEDLVLHIICQSPDNITVRVAIEMVYYVEFFDPVPLGKS